MKSFLVSFSFLVLSFSAVSAFAHFNDFNFERGDDSFVYDDYYVVADVTGSENFNLLKFKHVVSAFPLPDVPYKRDVHFGGWLRSKQDGSCLNTRGQVLVRDSVKDVEYSANGCTVTSGEWNDPYTGSPHYSARDIQIDHLVALKNAYMSGAFEWDFKKRCLYANYLGNNFHLLSVDGPQNMKKSDSSPSGYIPPNRSYTCQYIKQWLYVKLIWQLRLTPKETDAIKQIAEENHCTANEANIFEVSKSELLVQRRYMQANANLCESAHFVLESF